MNANNLPTDTYTTIRVEWTFNTEASRHIGRELWLTRTGVWVDDNGVWLHPGPLAEQITAFEILARPVNAQ